MNEQLIVKNFGPIKDATVDFKQVTVFIGPTGGGKSTLAKLAAVFRDSSIYTSGQKGVINSLTDYGIEDYSNSSSFINWVASLMDIRLLEDSWQLGFHGEDVFNQAREIAQRLQAANAEMKLLLELAQASPKDRLIRERLSNAREISKESDTFFERMIAPSKPYYFPAERILLAAISGSWTSFIGSDASFPKTLLNFAQQYSQARLLINTLDIEFLNIYYEHQNEKDIINLSTGATISLSKAASGIQSIIPLLVTLEYIGHNVERAQSFIIEEPELNLYPTAQQGLLNWLVEKCTKSENDLTITTHSPYLLAHFNTLLFAHQVAQNHPDRADEIAKVVPRESWIDPKEFAAYHVEGQKENGVRSIVNPETGLISYNGLDAIASAEATEFEKLLDINAGLAIEW